MAGYDPRTLKQKLQQARDYAALGPILAEALDSLGFTSFNYGAPNYRDSILSSMDPEWIRRYIAGGYFRSDKLVLEAAGRTSPFRSSEIFVDPPTTVREAEMEAAIAQHPQGLVVPIHCPMIGFAVLAAYNGMTKAEFDAFAPGARAQLSLLAHDFHDEARTFYVDGERYDMAGKLSTRERELLEWAARGKTASEIAQLVDLSKNTVNNHLASVRRKLGTKSIAAAIAITIGGEWRPRLKD